MVNNKPVKFFEGWCFKTWTEAIGWTVAAVGICLAICAFLIGFYVISTQSDYIYENTVTYTVESGDTLWTIAKHYSSEAQDVRKTVDIIQDINGCTATIYPGQQLEIPVYKNMGGK